MTAHRGYTRRYSDAQLIPEVAKELAFEHEPRRRVSIATIYDPKKNIQSLDGSQGRFMWQTSLDKPEASTFIVNNPSTWKAPSSPTNEKQRGTKDLGKVTLATRKLESVPETSTEKKPVQREIPSWKKDLFDKASKMANSS